MSADRSALKHIELATVAQRMLPQGCNSLGNLNRLPDARLVGLCSGLLEGLPVLLCGAGPSLDKDVRNLRRLADRSVVVAVSTAASCLVSKGIRVDAIAVMESMDTSRPVRELGGKFETAWLDIASHPNTWKACEGKPILAWHGPSPEVWTATWGLDAIPIVHGGSVTTSAASCALLMGCRDLTLVGCDFAFADDGRVYADGSGWGAERMELEEETDDKGVQWANYRDRLKWKDDLVEEGSGVRVPQRRSVEQLEGWNGEPRWATMDYVTQLWWFEDLNRLYPHARLTNCSEGGAKIRGFNHRTLAQHIATTKAPGRLSPGEAYALRLEQAPCVGERAHAVKWRAEDAARSAAEIGDACLSGRPAKGLPWLHDTGTTKAFTVEREIALMLAMQDGQPISHAQSVAIRRSDAVQAEELVNQAMEPETCGE